MKMILMALGLAFTFAVVAPALNLTPFLTDQAFAKDGADDGPDGADDNGGHGGDDGPDDADDNGGHGGDDGPDDADDNGGHGGDDGPDHS